MSLFATGRVGGDMALWSWYCVVAHICFETEQASGGSAVALAVASECICLRLIRTDHASFLSYHVPWRYHLTPTPPILPTKRCAPLLAVGSIQLSSGSGPAPRSRCDPLVGPDLAPWRSESVFLRQTCILSASSNFHPLSRALQPLPRRPTQSPPPSS